MQQPTRSAGSVAMWVLTVLLAGVFVTTGVSKLIGTEPIGLQAAAMRGFPDWIRVIVGIAEVAGAIALFIAPVAGVAAGMLAFLMVPAALTQWISGEPGVFMPALVFLLLLVLAWLRSSAAIRQGYGTFVGTPRPLLRQGVMAGAIGATVIALWFFGIDLVAGRPLFTPVTLGQGLLRTLAPSAPESTAAVVLSYTIFHYAAFVLVGLVAVLIVDAANREPSLLFGFLILFVAMEVGFYAFVSLLQQVTELGSLAWYSVMAGNLLAVLAMGTYLLRAHPALRQQFRHALDGSPPPAGRPS